MAVVYLDIENIAGQRQGSGPITSADFWRCTARMDRAGEFEFEMPATDPKAFAVQKKRIVRAYAILNGQRVEVGAGIIDYIEKIPQPDGKVVLRVSGDDLVRELTYRSVLDLALYTGGNPVTHAAAVAAVEAYAPAGWTFTADGSPPHNAIYGYFNGETVLQGAIKVADKSQNHFYKGDGRSLIFASVFTSSGVRAIQAKGELVANTCAITELTQSVDTYDLITRIYPRGSGNANVQLTLRATSRSAPSGYTLNAAQNYIEHDASVATYGVIERQVDFRDIGPIENTATDIQSAANALFDAALETLQQRSTELEQETYALQVEGCSQLLRPMQSIRLAYRDLPAGLNINDDLNILESTWQVDNNGIQTTDLVVSNVDRWPRSDVGVIVDGIEQGHVYQALQQLNANSYTMPHLKYIDDTETATIDLDLGSEVTQVQQILMRFRLKAFESTVKSVGGASSGSGDIPTSGPSTPDTSTGGNNETGTGGSTSTGSTTPTIGSTTPDIGGATPSIGSTTPTIGTTTQSIGVETPTIGSTILTMQSVTPTINPTSLTTNTASLLTNTTSLTTNTASLSTNTTSLSVNPTGLETDEPEGGDIVSSGRHQHSIAITEGAASVLYPVGYGAAGTAGGLISTVPGGGIHNYVTNQSGNHTHEIGDHTHSIGEHTHTIGDHSHSLPNHNHTLPDHSHSISNHAHTIAPHTHSADSHSHFLPSHNHTVSSHTHTVSSHTHTIGSHTHTIASHTHTIAAHTHSMTAHTHSMAQHTHSLNNHTHDLSDSIVAVYGIFREVGGNTYGIGDLQYRVNGGGWVDLDTATDLGGGRYELDITALIVNATTLRQNQELNTIDFRRDPVAAADKTVMLDVQVKVRTIIQAIALT